MKRDGQSKNSERETTETEEGRMNAPLKWIHLKVFASKRYGLRARVWGWLARAWEACHFWMTVVANGKQNPGPGIRSPMVLEPGPAAGIAVRGKDTQQAGAANLHLFNPRLVEAGIEPYGGRQYAQSRSRSAGPTSTTLNI